MTKIAGKVQVAWLQNGRSGVYGLHLTRRALKDGRYQTVESIKIPFGALGPLRDSITARIGDPAPLTDTKGTPE